MKPILVSGMQPTGRLHVGNYLGALKNFVELQNSGEYQCYFFLADLHALTEGPEPPVLGENILNLAADYLAAGLDPKKSLIYQQSLIPAHSELAWILNTVTPMGELERMTQYKDKAARQAANVNAGLLTYPVLMAADIILYGAKFVPVGDDQMQHLELTRTVARRFNARFGGETFLEPKGVLTQTPRVMSLKDPLKKMSKSDPESCLFIDDSPEDIRKKLARAVTDSDGAILYDPERKPGLSNLLEIYGAFEGKDPHAVAIEFEDKQYSDLKASLAELIAGHFAEFRAKKAKLLAKPAAIRKIFAAGSKKAAVVADKKMAGVKKKVGY
ncbi:MAG TPA: tryptophan--tRNA ligase [Candidatus Paceibacterota bacterium]|nr:tryptophan--tRNA ligase [Candidatus Paceibacterota bacterium]